jgi:chromosome segregation ATPase
MTLRRQSQPDADEPRSRNRRPGTAIFRNNAGNGSVVYIILLLFAIVLIFGVYHTGRKKIGRLQKSNADLKLALESCKSDVNRAVEKLKAAEIDVESLESAVTSKDRKVTDIQSKLEQKKVQAAETVASVKKEMSAALEKAGKEKQSALEAAAEKHKKELAAAEKEKQAALAEAAEKHAEKLNKIQSGLEEEIARLKAEKKRITRELENAELEKQTALAEAADTHAEKLNDIQSGLEQEIARLKAENKRTTREMEEKLQKEKQNTQATVTAAVSAEREKAETEKAALGEQIAELETALEIKNTETAEVRAQKKELADALQARKKELAKLKTRLGDTQAKLETVMEQNDRLMSYVNRLEKYKQGLFKATGNLQRIQDTLPTWLRQETARTIDAKIKEIFTMLDSMEPAT